jgi:hypothetical protein
MKKRRQNRRFEFRIETEPKPLDLVARATCLVAAAIPVSVDAVAAAFDRLADECAGETTGNGANGRTTPAVADRATDDSTGAGADRSALFRRRAGCERADQGADEYNLLHHDDISPRFFGRLDTAHEYKNDNNDEN